jgi:diguanylate cyclase (GGDEF)-like protein/PAS domain S-box-containing protein
MANLNVARVEGKYETEGWRVRQDGSRFWAHVVIDALHDPGGELFGYAKITRDCSDQRRLALQAEARAQALLAASQQQEQRFRALVEGVTDYAIYLLDPDGIVSNWNAGAQRTKQYRASEIVGQYFGCFYSREDQIDGLPAHGLEIARTRGKYNAEGWRIRKDGTRFWANVVIQPVYDDAGLLFGFAKITRDCTEQREAADRIHHLAHHDALTGLPNRPAFQDRLREALVHASGPRSGFALFYLDLDGFKVVNDTLGHHFGDTLLKWVSGRFADVLAQDEHLSRLGGDEFTIISMRCQSAEDARLIAHKCIETLTAPFDLDGHEVRVGVSIGIVSQAFSAFDQDKVLQQADLALYKAKREGRNQHRFYERGMNDPRSYG